MPAETPALVTAARKYLGTRFRHRGRSSFCLDCVGLGWRAYADCGVVLPDQRYYGRLPHDGRLMASLAAALGEPVATGPLAAQHAQAGDVGVFAFDEVEPHHVGLIGTTPYGELSLIHADARKGEVVEHILDATWRARMVALFRRPV